MAVTPKAKALEVLGHSLLSRCQTFVHYDPRNLQSEPFRQFFDSLQLILASLYQNVGEFVHERYKAR